LLFLRFTDVFAYLSERTISDLSLIAQWLYGTGRSEGDLFVLEIVCCFI